MTSELLVLRVAAVLGATTLSLASCSADTDSAVASTPSTTVRSTVVTTTIPPSPQQQALIEARAIWSAAKPSAYTVTVTAWAGMMAARECSWRVRGADVSVADGADVEFCTTVDVRTPDEMFVWIEAAIEAPWGEHLDVEYDDRGVPVAGSRVIPDAYDLDSGWSMTVTPV